MSDLRNDIKNVRTDYDSKKLNVSDVPKNPLDLFKIWMKEAMDAKLNDPNAFVLSTSNGNIPDSRVVLLRDVSEKGLVFYTNYTSQKAEDIAQNPFVSLNFYWPEQARQLRIHAKVEKQIEKDSDEYFSSRPRESQIGAWASNQSSVLKDRADFEKSLKTFEQKFENVDVPRPDFWGGYLMVPTYYEFWHGQLSRLHDRICYELKDGIWSINQLYP